MKGCDNIGAPNYTEPLTNIYVHVPIDMYTLGLRCYNK